MSDLISRQKAIDIVISESTADGAYGYVDTKSVVRLINSLPSAQQWIPVTPETMPEDYGTYICTCFDGCANRVTFVKWKNKLKQWILNGSRSYWKVIAWMPLPEPYRGG